MYIVEIKNGETVTTIHGLKDKLQSGKIVQGINAIDSFTFTMFPDNPGFSLINEFTTLVTAYNDSKGVYDFIGRVLYAETTMSEEGMILKTVTCENVLGYLCDSQQTYTDTKNWTVSGLLNHLIDCHNSQVEPYKQIKVGTITATDKNDNLYEAVQRENTWDAIKNKLIDKIGGELQCRIEEDGIYLDYLDQIGEEVDTEIALSVNMKAITREQDPTSFVTRLIPLGCKLKKTVEVEDEDGNVKTETVETEERLNISSVNNGLKYIDDEAAIAVYGIHVGIVEWDDVTTPNILKTKGEAWLKENNKVSVKYSITAVDLSLLGYVLHDFRLGNRHPVKNGLIGIDDTARIIKRSIDVCEETKSTIEVGDNLKSLSDIQRDQATQLKNTQQQVGSIKTDFDNDLLTLKTEITKEYTLAISAQAEVFTSQIEQLSNSIKLEVSGSLGSKANILLTAGANEYSYEMDMSQVRKAFADDATAISISAGLITFNAGTLVINSSKFKLNAQGKIEATDAVIYGDIITVDGAYKTEMDKGSLRLYYNDVLCGTINTKYWSNASSEGISLRVEEGGKYIMFSHADDTQGSGYVVDYYLNGGWSSNYDEMHIFQTSARFLDDVYFAGYTRIRSLRLFGSDGEYLVGINSSGGLSVSKL